MEENSGHLECDSLEERAFSARRSHLNKAVEREYRCENAVDAVAGLQQRSHQLKLSIMSSLFRLTAVHSWADQGLDQTR